ncbi:MAG: DUF4339 domain-containing protein [Planctomycetes bacterium]|nr:DUF4339 domain-containing protein [Planctomycetota bacterium]
MADQWFYRMFGEEFGPMPLDKLKELAEGGTIQALDYVRSESSGEWVAAATVGELGLSASERRTVATMDATTDLEFATSLDDLEVAAPTSNNDEWFCQLGGQELGPLSFDELIEYAEHEQLSADDHVKLGSNGKWRRVGSIGRLMTALPYQAVEKNIVRSAPKPKSDAEIEQPIRSTPTEPEVVAASATPAAVADPDATYRVAYEQAKAKVAESMMAQADALYKVAEDQANAQVSWALAPAADKSWWGWAGGVEFGPVEFQQVFGLAKSGQLKPSDFVRNGSHGQFIPSSNVPGLFKAVEMIARAVEARDLAKAQAQAAASLAVPPPTAPTALLKAAEKAIAAEAVSQQSKSNPVIPTQPAPAPRSNPMMETVRQPRTSNPQVPARSYEYEPEPEPQRPEPSRNSSYTPAANSGYSSGYSSAASGGFGSSSNSTMSTYGSRPMAAPPKPVPRRSTVSESTWFSDTLENLKEPKAIGSICVIAFVLLIFGWGYLPKSRAADIKRYQALKSLLDEIRTKRTSAPAELVQLSQKLSKVAKEIENEVKKKASRDDPAKQSLLWATRDEVPRMIQAGLGTETAVEQSFANRLKEASYDLGLEKRPPVDLAQLARMNNE